MIIIFFYEYEIQTIMKMLKNSIPDLIITNNECNEYSKSFEVFTTEDVVRKKVFEISYNTNNNKVPPQYDLVGLEIELLTTSEKRKIVKYDMSTGLVEIENPFSVEVFAGDKFKIELDSGKARLEVFTLYNYDIDGSFNKIKEYKRIEFRLYIEDDETFNKANYYMGLIKKVLNKSSTIKLINENDIVENKVMYIDDYAMFGTPVWDTKYGNSVIKGRILVYTYQKRN